MGREITITDTTLRDGQQSLWATRMPTAPMVEVARHQSRSGVGIVDAIGHPHFLASVRFCRENPWDRLRAIRAAVDGGPQIAASVGFQMLGSFGVAPLDVRELFIECLIRNGVDYVRGQHGLTDVDIIVENLQAIKRQGGKTILGLVYSISPVHTDTFFEDRLSQILQRVEVDQVMIKDSGGLLTPESTGGLVDSIRRAAGSRQVSLHSHCMTGLAPRVYMIGAEHGVDDVQCGIWPLAQGSAQPSMQTTVRNLREEGYVIDVVDHEIDESSAYLSWLVEETGMPAGQPQEYDHAHYRHQIPGGMISNLRAQLEAAGLLGHLDDLLHEVARVRAELGWPTMVTPYAQFVANQALFNVLRGERYAVVPDETKMYVLGHYGAPLAPIDDDVRDRIMARGAKGLEDDHERILQAQSEPGLPDLRRRFGNCSDEELLLRYMCSPADLDDMVANKGHVDERWRRLGVTQRSGHVISDLLAAISARTDVAEVSVETSGMRLRVRN